MYITTTPPTSKGARDASLAPVKLLRKSTAARIGDEGQGGEGDDGAGTRDADGHVTCLGPENAKSNH